MSKKGRFSSAIPARLGWKHKRTSAQLVEEMMASDLTDAKRDVVHGKRTV
ncbi:hypothetical protein [uncultured Bradyrhizobium sp.]|jgi:GDPmannose 4,6-dehydratase